MRHVPAFTSLELVVASLLLALVLAIGYAGVTQVKRSLDRERTARQYALDILRLRARLAADVDAGRPDAHNTTGLMLSTDDDTVFYTVMDSTLIRRSGVFSDTLIHGVGAVSIEEEARSRDGQRIVRISVLLTGDKEEDRLVLEKRYSAQEAMMAHGRAY